MRVWWGARIPALALGLAVGCGALGKKGGGPKGTPEEALRVVDAVEEAARKDPDRLWHADWLRYLSASDSVTAQRHFESALRTSNAAWALAGLAELREDLVDTDGAVKLWLEAIDKAPEEPVAELAALRLLDVEGDSPAADERIARAAAAAKAPMAPRAARLLREAAARIAARFAAASGQVELEARAWQAAGAIQHYRIAGPFAASRLFDLAKPLALDGPKRAVAPERGSTGPSNARAYDAPDGDVGLEMEPGEGDVYYAASELTMVRGGKYLLWIEGAAALEARLDGQVAISRVPYPREMQRAQSIAVSLRPGKHDFLVRWSRAEGPRFRAVLARGDGDPSDVSSAVPPELAGLRKASPCGLGMACLAKPAWLDGDDLRAWAEKQMERSPADPVAAWMAARATMGDDRASARTYAERATMLAGGGAAALALRGQQLLRDGEMPERIARGRAMGDLADAARKNPMMARLRLTAAALARESERFDDAALELDKAEAVLREQRGPDAPLPGRYLVSRARLFEARGNAHGARTLALQALKTEPGRCDAGQVLYDVARRDGTAADQDRAAKLLVACPDSLGTRAQLLRERGDLAGAEALLARAAALRPSSPARLDQLAETQTARKELDAARQSLEKAAARAPRAGEPLRRLAGLQELAGNPKAAIELRKRALPLAPGDLVLRKQVAFDDGQRLLAWADRDGIAAAKRPMPEGIAGGASSVRLLDYGAAEIYPDGGGIERVHTVVRVLDKKGIGKFGEAQIPQDAQVLRLRTIKRDGRILEPESIPEKEGISLPGLEAGDAVEIEYDRPIGPRGPDMPGWTLAGFFFRDDETPMGESSYEVRAPGPFEVDAHNLTLPPGALTGGQFRYGVDGVAPLRAEPHAAPESEIMPWVQLGTGAGQAALIRSVADWLVMRTRPSSTSDALARAAGGSPGRDQAEKIVSQVGQMVRGRSQSTDFSANAAHVVAQGRGNRLLAIKAVLASAGIRSHLVFVRPFGVDPRPYRFPRGDLYTLAVLRIDLPGGPVWVDSTYRLAPFGQLPAFARGQNAWVVPEPGEEPQEIRTPARLPGEDEGREVAFELKLDGEGVAVGLGRDTQKGFEAASLKDLLERLDHGQRKQAVEAMLGRGMRGLTLTSLGTDHETEMGGTALLVYGLKLQLARKDGPQLFVPSSVVPLRAGRRWAEKAERQTTLLIDAPEKQRAKVSLLLPPGMRLAAASPAVSLQTPFGTYAWSAREEKGTVVVEESIDVPLQRIPPASYPAFVAFARAIDAAQSQELTLGPSAPKLLGDRQ